MARQIGYGALTITDVTDGINNATVYLYQRFASVTGHTPPANKKLTYNFTTGKLTGAIADFNGWSQKIPNGNDPLYVVTAVATSVENTYIIPAWNDETRLVVNGEDGQDGDDGTSITAVKEVYYFTTGAAPAQSTLTNGTAITSTSTDSNVWTTVVPAYSAGGHYYTSLQTSLSKGTSPVFSAISLDQALTDANNNAAIAKSIAQANEENAQGALAISQGLESRLRYIWVNLNDPSSLPNDITKTTSYLGGTYAASGIDETAFVSSNPSTYGWNSLLRHDKLMFRYNGIALTTLGIDGLKLYAPIVSNNEVTDHQLSITMTAGNSGALTIYNPVSNKAGMVLNSSGLTFYKYNTTNLEAAATLNGTGLNITAGSIKLGDNFEATSEGVITAKSGTIGNLHIAPSSLYTGTHSAYNSAVAGIFINDTYISFGSEAVTYFKNDGSAKIGNWRFNTAGTQYADSAAISDSVTKQGRIYLAPGNVNQTKVAIGIGTRTDSSADYSYPCYMRGDGYFYASNANIRGTITAKAGSIGGFHITGSTNTGTSAQGGHIYTNSFYRHSGDGTAYEYEVGMKGDATENPSSANTQTGNLAFYIKRIAKGANWSTATNIFYITHAGAIYASSADITGKITANSGKIGGWNIGTDTNKSLYYGNQTPGATTTNLVLSSTSATNTTAIAGSGTGKTWFISAGRNFGVDTAGKLYATGAVISGALTATSLTIDGTNYASDVKTISSKATPQDVTTAKEAAEKTATNYITRISSKGIRVHAESGESNRVAIDDTGVYVYKNNKLRAEYGDSVILQSSNGTYPRAVVSATEAYLQYKDNSWTSMTENGLQIRKDGSDKAHFYDTITLYGGAGTYPLTEISSSAVKVAQSANNYARVNSSGMQVYQGGVEVATFGSKAIIGKTSSRHIEITDGGLQIYMNSSVAMAHIGYGNGNKQSSGTAEAPYFTFGIRNGTPGNYSVAEGSDTEASGWCSHAEGYNTTASKDGAHAEGSNTTASALGAHAAGIGTMATAEGQTAVGKYNTANGNSLFIVGYGSSDSSRANAFTVSNAGNIQSANKIIAGTSLTANDGLIKTTYSGKTTTIGSQNSSYCHIYTDAAEFAFNKGFAMVGNGTLGDTSYPAGGIYMKNDGHLYGKETGGTARALIWLSTSNTVNVGNGSNPTYVNGTSFSGSKSYTGSDLRLKHSIIPLDERSFELLMRMKPFEYEWNEGEEHYYSKGKCFGLGAQEVLEALEEVGYTPSKYRVVERDPDGYYAVSYIELIPHLIYVIQKQQHEIDKLKEVINVHYS